MGYRILLAGAAGAIGSRLVPLLLDAGHAVVGTTRSPAKADMLRASGVEPLVVDVFEAGVLKDAVVSIRPEIVIHQLTDLPPGLDPSGMAQAIAGNARIRDEGTRNLVRAAVAAGSRRLIVKALHGPMPRASCLTGRMLRSTGTPKATARSPSMESSHWNDRYSAPHRSKASSFAMGDCMAPEPGSTRRLPRCPSMSTQPPTPPCWRSIPGRWGFSTSPSRTTRSPRKKPPPSWAGTPASVFHSGPLRSAAHDRYRIRLAKNLPLESIFVFYVGCLCPCPDGTADARHGMVIWADQRPSHPCTVRCSVRRGELFSGGSPGNRRHARLL